MCACKAGVTADRCNKLITAASLWHGYSAFVKKLLEIGLGPCLIEPIAWIVSGFSKLLRDGVVVVSGSSYETISLGGLRSWNAIFIEERLELRIRPAA